MKIEQAIKVLKQELDGYLINYPKELKEAQKLGIEALKRVNELRAFGLTTAGSPLPGEAED